MQKQSFELIKGMSTFARVHTLVHDGTVGKLRFFLTLGSNIKRIIKNNPGISVIHYNDGLMAAFCLLFVGRSPLKQVVTLHGLDAVYNNRLYQRYIFPKFKRLDLVIAVSKATAKQTVLRGLDADKMIVIPNGVDHVLATHALNTNFYEEFQRISGIDLQQKKLLFSIGRSVKRKGFSWFVEKVMPLLHQDVVLILAGPFNKTAGWMETLLNLLPTPMKRQLEFLTGFPADERTLRKLLRLPEVRNRVFHAGKMPYNQIQQLLTACHAFVMPNNKVKGDMEGFGLVSLEASLAGATVFASNIEGITDAIVPGGNGYLLPSQDAEAWAATLNKYLSTGAVDAPVVINGRQYTLNNFSWTKMAGAYYDAFVRLYNTEPVILDAEVA